MLPQIPVIRIADAQKLPLPSYFDGLGTSMVLRSAETKSIKISPRRYEILTTGLAIALPIGMEAQIRSLKESTETGVIVLNAPVTIDCSDRKEIKICLYNASQEAVIIKPGDPIALMIFSMALRVKWHDLTPGVEGRENSSTTINTFENKIKEPKQFDIKETSYEESKDIFSPNPSFEEIDSSEKSETITLKDTSKESVFLNPEDEKADNIEATANTDLNISSTTDTMETKRDGILTEAPTLEENIKHENTVVEDLIDSYSLNTFTELSSSENTASELNEDTFNNHVLKQPVSSDFTVIEDVTIANTTENSIPEEKTSLVEPVGPPAILDEFEKIESEYANNIMENKI